MSGISYRFNPETGKVEMVKPGPNGPAGAVNSVTGGAVDNADPANPIIGAPYWVKITKSYTDFSVAALTNTINIYTIAAKGFIHSSYVVVNTEFDGPSAGKATIGIGSASDGNIVKYMNEVSIAYGNTTMAESYNPLIGMESLQSEKFITATLTSDINLNALTQGSVSIYLLISKLP